MLRNIIFDFGDVFINLDKLVVVKAMAKYDVTQSEVDVIALNNAYETGQISTSRFLDDLTTGFPGLRKEHLQEIWNSMLLDFPEYRLQFLEELKDLGQYRLFLLSNTNALHISHVIYLMGQDRFDRFKNCFEGFYLSHKIGMRKPDLQVFEFVLQQNKLKAEDTLFIDDSPVNTTAARSLNIKTWQLKVGSEDITDLKMKL